MKKPVVVCVFTAALATAQLVDAQDQDPQQGTQQDQSQGLQEVIVTAERHTEDIQQVPIAISAFSATDLQRLGMNEGFDLANQVPNMNIDKAYGDSNVRYFIRGVGTQDFSTLATSPVAVYTDDVFMGSTVGNSVDMYDMQRVEVLRGPQGTLWGMNTTGGAINFISAHPTQHFEADVSGGYGNHGARTADSMVNIPIGSTLAMRAVLTYSGQDNWVTNLDRTGPQNLEAYSKVGGRLSFEWKPNDDLTAYLKGEYLKRTGSTITPHMVPIKGNTDAYGDPALPIDEVDQGGGPSSDDFQTWDVTARLDWRLGSSMKLVSISAWDNADRIHEYELDGGTPFILFNGSFFGNHDQFTQELRLMSTDTGPLRWQGGVVYYFAREGAVTGAPNNLATPPSAGTVVSANLWPETRRWNSKAAFGGAQYDLTSSLTVKAGFRYNYDQGSYHAQHWAINPYANYLNYLNPNPAADPNAVLKPADAVNASAHWSKPTWDAGLIYHVSPNAIAYFTASKGYRQGTFSSPTGANSATFAILQPETNQAFELGIKSSWLDHKLQVDAAAFNYNYTNMQVFSLAPITALGVTGLFNIESNAGKAQDRGGEIEVKAAPAKGWLITSSVGYVHAIFTQFETFNRGTGTFQSLAGNRFPRQPQWTASEQLEYSFQLAGGQAISLDTDWNYRGDYFVNPNNAANPYIPGRTIGDVRASFAPASERWQVSLWAKNVTDKHYAMGGYGLGFINSNVFYDGDPLTYGVSFDLRF